VFKGADKGADADDGSTMPRPNENGISDAQRSE
jgi:hypothetical protein